MSGDAIIGGLLDTDFYKLLMLQLIWRDYPDVEAEFALINRTAEVRIAEEIDLVELRRQLDHVRNLAFSREDIDWIASNRFADGRPMFDAAFLEFLPNLRLSDYELGRQDGQISLRFCGRWIETTMWEIPALALVNELRTRSACARLGRAATEALYRCADERLQAKLDRLKRINGLRLTDFGTRRRHSLAWQDHIVGALKAALHESCIGTSNAALARKHGVEAIGTNGHELPMVIATLAEDDEALRAAPYRVLEDWRRLYSGKLLIVLPDTFGSRSFLRHAPDWVADWTGFRPDSAPAIEAGEEIIRWWCTHGKDPREKLLIFSDALDVDAIESIHCHFEGRVRMSFGWGTNLTNDFAGCAESDLGLRPVSLVCKVVRANGRSAVKLSDNPNKAVGAPDEVQRYLRVFGEEGMAERTLVY